MTYPLHRQVTKSGWSISAALDPEPRESDSDRRHKPHIQASE